MDRPDANLRRKAFVNTAAQILGRVFASFGRLAVGSLIVRSSGREIFGEYALVLTLVALSEWVLDFGTGDVFVREACSAPERRDHLLRVLTATKAVQLPMAALLLCAVCILAGYSRNVVEAVALASISLLFSAGISIYRVLFRSRLTMQFEIIAELLSVAVMIAGTYFATQSRASLSSLALVYAGSRALMFFICTVFALPQFRLSVSSVQWQEIVWGLKSSWAIGAAGFGMIFCDSLDFLLLPRFASLSDLGYYSGAQKLVWPLLVPMAAIGSTLFSVSASYWPDQRLRFYAACQRGISIVLALSALILTPVFAGAPFLMNLLGPDLVPGAPALRILTLAVFVKTISLTLGAVLPVVHGQNHALRIVGFLIVAKALTVAIAATAFGYVGVAWGVLGLEILFASIGIWLLGLLSGFRVDWNLPSRIFLCGVVSVCVGMRITAIPFWSGASAALSYVLLLWASRTFHQLGLHSEKHEVKLEQAAS